jgi:hypothetical protein
MHHARHPRPRFAPHPTPLRAIRVFAGPGAIFPDPVHSGNGAAGLIDHGRSGRFTPGERVVVPYMTALAASFGQDAPRIPGLGTTAAD